MKKITSFILTTLGALASVTALQAETVQLRNTAGTELTGEVNSTEGNQVTFTRTSDGMEFTIPLSMLDEPSRQKVTQWEEQVKYLPDSAPFFKLGDQYVIPINIEGNQITFFNANSQKQSANHPKAQKLQALVEENKTALSKRPGLGFEGIQQIRSRENKILTSESGATAVLNSEYDLQFYKEYKTNEPFMHEISYEIFLPKDIETEKRNYLAKFSALAHLDHPLIEELKKGTIQGRFSTPLPVSLKSGNWVKSKTIVRTLTHAGHVVYFGNIENIPVGVRNLEFKPVEPNKNLITLSDLIDGYNIFTSNKPFEIKPQGYQAVEIHANALLLFHLNLDIGYEIEVKAEYENGKITARSNADLYRNETNLKEKRQSIGSRQKVTITFNTHNDFYPLIFLNQDEDKPMIIHNFNVSITKRANAAELNAFHR